MLLAAIVIPLRSAFCDERVLSRLALPEVAASAVDSAIEAAMQADDVRGLAIGIVREREIVYVKGYGTADRAGRRPVTPQTCFRWASCAKPLAAIAAMQLVEQGRLDLDADVRTFVPEFPDPGAVITPRQLLCHQSGIVHYSNGPVIGMERKYEGMHPFEDPVCALDRFCRSPLLFKPGTQESYSSHAYVLLSAVIQRAGEEPYPRQIRSRIAEPIGAETLQPDFSSRTIPDRAEGLRKVAGIVVPSVPSDVGWKHGAGGYISSIEDFTRFARGLIRRQFVSEQSEAAMWTRQPLADGAPGRFGLGFAVEEQNGRLKVSHNGSQAETKTRLVLYPTEGHGVVVMTHCEWADPGKYSTLVYQALAEDRIP